MAFALRRPPRLVGKHDPYPYQLDAVRAIRGLEYAAIFHEQGLGKTKIAIDLIHSWLEQDVVDTVFVITKKSLVRNWMEEIRAHSYLTPRVLSTDRHHNSIALNSPVLVYVLNYEVVMGNAELLRSFLATCRVAAILDESQKIKNPESRLAICFHDLADCFDRRIIMTGTPVANRPFDIWSQIRFLDGGTALGRSFAAFRASHDLPNSDIAGGEYGSQLARIMNRIRQFSVRDTKRSAGIELPDKTILSHRVALAPRQREVYGAYRDRLRHDVLVEDGEMRIDSAEELLKLLLRLVQCASNPVLVDPTYDEKPGKYSKLKEIVGSSDEDGKVIVWSNFVDNVEWLAKAFQDYRPTIVHGRMALRDRDRAVATFKHNDRCRLLVATPGAAKEGLTLTVANQAVFYDRSFSLDDYIQAQDRIHRISQVRTCFVHNMIADGTIDEWVDLLLNAKHQAAQLAQGDIDEAEFGAAFAYNLHEALRDILAPSEGLDGTKDVFG